MEFSEATGVSMSRPATPYRRNRPKPDRRRALELLVSCRAVGQAFLICLALGGCGATAQNNGPSRETFAEMIAFARLAAVPCKRLAPDAESFRALTLLTLVKPPLTEKEIVGQGKGVKQLRHRLGLRKWWLPTISPLGIVLAAKPTAQRAIAQRFSALAPLRHHDVIQARPLTRSKRSCGGHHQKTGTDPSCVKTH
jgi:hypothetical protein